MSDHCPPPPAYKTAELSDSLADQLKLFSKSQLKHQQTSITYQTGRRVIVDGEQIVEESVAQTGYVVDNKPDQLCYKVVDGLFIGSQDCVTDMHQLNQLGITHILNLVPDLRPLFPEHFVYKTVPVLDLDEADLLARLPECLAYVAAARRAGSVVVHCNAGVSRSASVVLAALLAEGWSLQRALAHLKQVRPAVQPNRGFLAQLQQYEAALANSLAS